jgi:hypothetical protein
MKRLIIFNFLCVSLIFFNSCKKPAGEGGNSSIKGKVWVQDYSKSFVLLHEYAGVDVEVYVIYGDETIHGDKVNTNANGEFEFKYLRKGSYKIYAVSEERIGNSNDVKDEAIIVNTSISKNKSTVDVGTITIKR